MAAGPSPWDEVAPRLEWGARRLLELAPEAIEEAAGEFERIERRLRELVRADGERGAGPPCPEARTLRELRRQVRLAALLLENAGALRLGWARVLSVMTAGYTPHGEPAALKPPATVAVEG